VLNVNFKLLKIIYVHLLVCYLNKLQNARCNDKYGSRPSFGGNVFTNVMTF